MASRDQFQRFIFEDSQVRGAWVRLNDSYSEIGNQAPYPASVRRVLGESLAASVLMSSTLKFEGTLSIQAQGEGSLSTLMAECSHDRYIRGMARFDEHAVSEDSFHELLGDGRMAITITPNRGNRYQGVVPRDQDTLAGCLEDYFERSEQIPTSLILFSDDNGAAGLLLQRLPGEVVAVLLDGLTGLTVVFLDVLFESTLLDLQAFLLGRQVGDSLFDVLKLVAHLLVGVVECLARILRPIEDRVYFRPNDVGGARKDSHSRLWDTGGLNPHTANSSARDLLRASLDPPVAALGSPSLVESE